MYMCKIDRVSWNSLTQAKKIPLQRTLSKKRPSRVIRCVGEKNFENPHLGALTRETAVSVSGESRLFANRGTKKIGE